jgi:hypothetical protein
MQAYDKKIPKDWTVKDVADWLKGGEFDEDTCDKFTSACLLQLV